MYTPFVKRTQIYLEEDLDRTLRDLARRQGRSAAAVIREALRRYLGEHGERRGGLLELQGLGSEVWADEDAGAYVDRLREEWPA